MLEILDSIIATVAIILGLSLIVQAVQQILKQIFDLKSSYMRAELLALFNTSGTAKRFATNFIPAGMLGNGAEQFAKDVVSQLEERMTTFGFTNLHLVENFDTEKFKEIVRSLPVAHDTTLRHKFDQALADIDRWFDVSKQAFQENYERRMKPWAFGIGAVLVVALNANLFDIYQEFSHSKALREAGVALAQQFSSTPKDSLPRMSQPPERSTSDSLIAANIRRNLQFVQQTVDAQSFQVMGWSEARLARTADKGTGFKFMYFLGGWLGTILLVSLGAPFWYDFLKTVTGIKDRVKAANPKP